MNKWISLSFVMFLLACAPVQKSENIKIGAVLALTSSLALNGQESREGFDLAVEFVNAKGGINGGKLIGVVEDSQTQASATDFLFILYYQK